MLDAVHAVVLDNAEVHELRGVQQHTGEILGSVQGALYEIGDFVFVAFGVDAQLNGFVIFRLARDLNLVGGAQQESVHFDGAVLDVHIGRQGIDVGFVGFESSIGFRCVIFAAQGFDLRAHRSGAREKRGLHVHFSISKSDKLEGDDF